MAILVLKLLSLHIKNRFMSEQCRNKEKKVASPKVLIIRNMCG